MSTVYALNPYVRFRAVAEEGVLVHVDSGNVVVVNEVGLCIVEWLKQAQSAKQLAQLVSEAFEVSAEQALPDVEAYLDLLLGEEVIVAEPTD